MKQTYALFLLLLYTLSSYGGGGLKHQATFAEKDIFQTAYFLKNVPGLIPDYDGQEVRYFGDHDGVSVFLTNAGPIYKLTKKDEEKIKAREKEEEKGIPTISSYTAVRWVGANPHPQIEPTAKNSGYYTYLARNSDKELHSIVTDGYSKVTYHDLYPGIDVEYTFPEKGGMKYNLIIHPGADVTKVQMEYTGAVKNLSKNKDGNITIHTETGDIVEHAPVSYIENGNPVLSSFEIQGTKVTFRLPEGYDANNTLIIDPWVNVLDSLTLRNLGTSVDYDMAGNVYVYGAGGTGSYDMNNYHKVAKFDPNGSFLWVFNGSVPSINWSSAMGNRNFLSNAKVDKATGKVYIGVGYDLGGARSIRISSTGVYDNFETQLNANLTEIWSFLYDCSTGSILALGGGYPVSNNMEVIDPNTGAVTASNITTVTGACCQDVASSTYDASGNVYVVIASTGHPQITNTLYRVNSTYNNYIWHAPTGYSTLWEGSNMRAFDNFNNGSSNNFNALTANSHYLFYYDGFHLAAYNLANGSMVGTPTVITGYDSLMQGGIAVDDCNHVYLGGQGVIKTFTFNGNVFTAGTDIPLGNGFSNDSIYDVRYNASNNLIYVTGLHIVGAYVATQSAACTLYSVSVRPGCHKAIAYVADNILASSEFSYVWKDSAGNVIRQTNLETNLTDTLSGINSGQYTVIVQSNASCQGYTYADTITTSVTDSIILSINDTAICYGQRAKLTATPNIPDGSYTWSPGGDTTQFILVNPIMGTTYTVAYSIATCGTATSYSNVTVYPFIKQTGIDTTICGNQIYVYNGHTYNASGIYMDTFASIYGCDSVIIINLTVNPINYDTIHQSICSGDSVVFLGIAHYASGTYNQTYTGANGCDSIKGLYLTVHPLPMVDWSEQNTIAPCRSSTLLSGSMPSGGYYSGPYVNGDSIISPPEDTTFTVSYIYIDTNGCKNSASLLFFSPLCTTGILNTDESSSIRLYPNPNNGSFILEAPQAIGSAYIIYDVLGQPIQQGIISAESIPISMSGTAAGIYALVVHTGAASSTIRFTVLK